MTGLEWLLTFLLGFEGSLRASAISENRQKRLQAEAEEKANLLTAIGDAQSLRGALNAIGTDVARLKAQNGMAPQEGPLFQLLLDETFQEDLANWLSARDPAEDSRLGSIVLDRTASVLASGGASPAEILRFREEYIERFHTELFRNTALAQWRMDLRIANLQSQLASESAATRAIVREQSDMLQAAIAKPARGYEADVEQLRRRTRLVLESLAKTAGIHIHGRAVKIPRLSVGAIGAAACDGHVIVVGDPGAGKSVGIYHLAASLQSEGVDVVVIDVQRTTADSTGALQVEFGLSHDLLDVLENWSGPGYGYLVIDALDAARSAEAAATFNDLVARCISRLGNWRVVVSVRKYDLRYNPDLQRLFRGVPPSQFADARFKTVRHVSIPVFSDNELEAIGRGSTELAQLVHAADLALRTLLRNPFNLRLMTELLDEGTAVAELTPIRTQIELLDRYWQARIIRDDRRGDAREGLLRRAAQTMTAARSLRIDRTTLAVDSPASERLHDLLSGNVLMEWQDALGQDPERYILTFSHNIIFDYAVERLLFRGDPAALARRLASERDLILAIRPSIAFYFHHLWSRDHQHQAFWETVLDLLGTDAVPRVAQLVGPSVATELAVSIEDFGPLVAALGSDNDRRRANAELAIAHIVGSLLASGVSLAGPHGGLWCEWAGQIADRISNATASPVKALLASINWDEQFPAAQLDPIGRAGRKLLELGLESPQNARFYLPVAIPAVCRTYALARTKSEDLIRRLIQPESLAQGRVEGLHWLAGSIKALMPVAPALVEDSYRAIFDTRDVPDDKVPLYDSQILPLTTTLRQEFDGARHQLVEAFGDFLVVAREHALRVLAHVVEIYIKGKRGHEDEPRVFEIPFGDQVAHFAGDASCIWDRRRPYEHDPPVMMLKTFQEHLAAIASASDAPAQFSAILGHIVAHHRRAVVWRRLLMSGAEHPVTLGRLLTPLLKAPIILITADTYTAAGELLRAVYTHLDHGERRAVETVIMSLPNHPLLQENARGERMRARMLGCLPLDCVATTAARDLIAYLSARNEIPTNEPTIASKPEDLHPDDIHVMMWRHDGIPYDSPENVAFRMVCAPVSEFCGRFLNEEPSLPDAQAIVPHIRQLQSALADGAVNGVHEQFLQDGCGMLASGCAALARSLEIVADPQLREIVTSVLLDASSHAAPEYSEELNTYFDHSQFCDGGSPRVKAAKGLMLLARVPEAATPAVMDAINRLAKDPVYAVRFEIAEKLRCLYHTKPSQMWRHIETMVTGDQSTAVLAALTSDTLHPLLRVCIDRVVPLVHAIFDRVRVAESECDPRAACLSVMVTAFLCDNQPEASHFLLFTLAENVSLHVPEMKCIIRELRQTLAIGPLNQPTAKAEAIRGRAWHLFNMVCQSARAQWDDLHRQYGSTPTAQIPTEIMALVQALAQLLDTAANELRFASECCLEKEAGSDNDNTGLRAMVRQRFWQECQPALDSLESTGVTPAVHHLVEFLDGYIDVAPEQVFIRLGRIIVAAEEGRYHHEAMAADLVVKIVERYLAQYRQIFHTSDECRQLIIRILDVFVGWPNARRLAYRLEDLYR